MSVSHQKACVIFNKLSVNWIEDTSGIFIGTNLAVGWNSYSKSNQGFGSSTNSSVSNIMNVVYDSDLVDSPVTDVKNITVPADSGFNQQCDISFQSINATSLSNGSTIDVGDNTLNAWSTARKTNYGNGKTNGSNQLRQFANIVMDNDMMDASSHIEGKIVEETQGS